MDLTMKPTPKGKKKGKKKPKKIDAFVASQKSAIDFHQLDAWLERNKDNKKPLFV